MKELDQSEIKKKIGKQAALLVEEGMRVGLGTGTTAAYFIESLIKRCQEGLKISAVASSMASMEQAKKGGIPMIPPDTFTGLDLTIDGADAIDPMGQMIKGGGGALVREKIVAASSKRLVILVDESKLVKVLGNCRLPVEILTFGCAATVDKIQKLGYKGKMRLKKDGTLYITDNGQMIFDIDYPQKFERPEVDHQKLIDLPGVIDTGFFLNLPLEVMIGYTDGRVEKGTGSYGRDNRINPH